jgi:hypothetical protein
MQFCKFLLKIHTFCKEKRDKKDKKNIVFDNVILLVYSDLPILVDKKMLKNVYMSKKICFFALSFIN